MDLLKTGGLLPPPFGIETVKELWTDPYTSGQMLRFHLDDDVDAASRKKSFIHRSVSWILDEFSLQPGQAVIDFGCGPGLYTLPLARQGLDVTGVDFSSRSLDYARARAEEEGCQVEYHLCDYLDYQPQKLYEAALLIMGDYCAMSFDKRLRFLRMVKTALKPGGFILFDLFSLSRFSRLREAETFHYSPGGGFWSVKPYYEYFRRALYREQGIVLEKYDIIEAGRSRVICNWLEHFSPEKLKRELAMASFVPVHFWGNAAGDPYGAAADEFAVMAVPR
jgi:SAM-dependent methyltransferase